MKTTKKQFKLFKKYCRKWAKEFGLSGYKFNFEHLRLVDSNAQYNLIFAARMCTIAFAKSSSDFKTDADIEATAIHEMFHVRLAYLEHTCRLQLSDELQEAQEHEIIHVIQKLLGVIQ